MSRIARLVAVGYPHHITQRGNYKQKTFRSQKDFLQYLNWIEEYCKKYLLLIFAYSLMPNHVHFIATPQKENSLSKSFGTAHGRYSQFFNKKHNLRGHLWQDRFYSCALDERHLYAAVRYVEKNPVEAGMVKKAWDWRWSSARAHVKGLKGRDQNGITLADINELIEINNWREYLKKKNEEEIIKKIKNHVLTGRPLGDENFIKNLERSCKRKLIISSPGRHKMA